ncbi:MFS transporter [Streptomyces sp. CS62]|uniref:MFS transporter n=1 Tax=Streptomyces sp. CS62 TaxID=3119268 RepID=UPI002F94183A
MDHPPQPAPAPRRTGRVPFALLACVQLLLNASVSVTFAAGPAMARELGLGRIDLVLDSSAYGLAFSGLLLFGGRLADRAGPRRLFCRGTALFAAASLAAALAPAAPFVLGARFLQGCGAALAAPAAMALLRAVHPESPARSAALARWGLLSSLGAAAGIVLSGLLTSWPGWRWSFGVLGAVAAAALVLAPRFLPAGAAPVRVPPDLPGAVLGTLALCSLGYGLVMAGPHGWTAAAVLGPLALGSVLLAAFAAAGRRSPAPLLPPGFLASRRRATALVCAMLGPAIGASTAFLLALWFQQERGWSGLQNALAFVPYSAVLVGVGFAAGRTVARLGVRTVAAGGLVRDRRRAVPDRRGGAAYGLRGRGPRRAGGPRGRQRHPRLRGRRRRRRHRPGRAVRPGRGGRQHGDPRRPHRQSRADHLRRGGPHRRPARRRRPAGRDRRVRLRLRGGLRRVPPGRPLRPVRAPPRPPPAAARPRPRGAGPRTSLHPGLTGGARSPAYDPRASARPCGLP